MKSLGRVSEVRAYYPSIPVENCLSSGEKGRRPLTVQLIASPIRLRAPRSSETTIVKGSKFWLKILRSKLHGYVVDQVPHNDTKTEGVSQV